MANPFLAHLAAAEEKGGFQTDDVLAAVLPLFRQIADLHAEERVAPLEGVAAITIAESGALRIDGDGIAPRDRKDKVEALQRPLVSALRVVGQGRVTADADDGISWQDLRVGESEEALTRPVYLPGYRTWEQHLEHHDALTDIFCAGQILASLACGLDFTDTDDVSRFAAHRDNLFALNPRLHPVIAAVIVEMTELNRHQRVPDLPSVIRRLETYRDQAVDLDVRRIVEGAEQGPVGRRKAIQTHLRDRLFDLSRRNRLLYFKSTQAAVNLTVASVPLVIDLRSIRPDHLLVWNPSLAQSINDGGSINLARYLRFEDQPYLPGALDKLISEARRDRAEYGFSQLRLVLSFLRWHNLKEAPEERIASPLLLLPVELVKKKGVRDQYVVQPAGNEAEVNPVLRHCLKQLYGIELPESVDLAETGMEQLHADLQAQIHASEPGVTLRLITEPEIELVYQRARQRLDQFRRRQKIHKPPTVENKDFSYVRSDWRPRGLQLFRDKVLPQPLPIAAAAGAAPSPRMPQMASTAHETEQLTYSLKGEGGGNPYNWDFDLCSLTLCNFNYRKMSLVRDYSALLEGEPANAAFDPIFSDDPKPLDDGEQPALPLVDRWPVVPGDATQSAAVDLARTGRSYIIQGPPGTGKSQTITNLIADYVARGKRVLFVCEKRAAIDVVFHRLRQQGLDELCCLIHDSQTDKKAFIQNLKQTYEAWLDEPDRVEAARERRQALLKRIEQELDALRRFDTAMRDAAPHAAVPLRQLFERLVSLRDHEPALSAAEQEQLPDFAVWLAHADLAGRLSRTLREFSEVDALAAHPFRSIGPGIVEAERPLNTLIDLVDEAESLLDDAGAALEQAGLAEEHRDSLDDLEAALHFAAHAAPLAMRGQLALLDAGSSLAQSLNEQSAAWASAASALTAANEKTRLWRQKLPAVDAAAALAQAQRQEQSILRLFQPSWWRLKRTVAAAYDIAGHTVAPSMTQILAGLVEEYQAENALNELRERARQQFGSDDLAAFAAELRALQAPDAAQPAAQALRSRLLAASDGAAIVQKLAAIAPQARAVIERLDQALVDCRRLTLAELGELLRDLREDADLLPEFLPLLGELAGAPAEFAHALRTLPLAPPQLEAAAARRALEQIYRGERWLPRFDGRVLAGHVERLEAAERELLDQNAETLRAEVRRIFRDHVHITTLSAAQLDTDGKRFKKRYMTGRRRVEHEFGKSMRYKAIRELASGESGMVVRDLKPIWLMSPLSVSDTLPLQPDLFDVVIFDEASQIPVEEAVPALYRAPQVIVVGDEMQLPPTSFFSAAGDGDVELEVEEGDERVAILMDADSLLSQSARSLPAALLAWHYRSRSESLIGFSNAAFYAGNLYTIPDRRLPAPNRGELRLTADNVPQADAVLDRPISFHLLNRGVYEQRRNAAEAAYIAQLVRELLARETGMSLGVVAFSEAQQSEIESALEALAAEDATFAASLEAEYQREEDDQFCGLFVKNLENVQGDERDIVLLSICYGPGPGPDGRMLMNFGPINQRGGEKRLNVIFSRARHHMVVVSSIRHGAITNDYNDGAAALKNFLRYAEASSRGDLAAARAVLENLNPLTRKALNIGTEADAVAEQLAAALRARGHEVDERVGQSRFRCDLAVRDAAGGQYAAGILIDTGSHYANPNLLERYVNRPGILRGFGWQVVQVLARDWYHEPEAVLARIERLMAGEREPVAEAVTSPPEQEVAPAEAPMPAVGQLAEPAAVASDEIAFQRLEFVGGNSRKFWEIGRSEATVLVRFGRLGTGGQIQEKVFDSAERAQREVDKLIAEKLRKGYQRAAETADG